MFYNEWEEIVREDGGGQREIMVVVEGEETTHCCV